MEWGIKGTTRTKSVRPIVFIFMPFSGKNGQIIGYTTPFGVGAPSPCLENLGSASSTALPWSWFHYVVERVSAMFCFSCVVFSFEVACKVHVEQTGEIIRLARGILYLHVHLPATRCTSISPESVRLVDVSSEYFHRIIAQWFACVRQDSLHNKWGIYTSETAFPFQGCARFPEFVTIFTWT